MKTVSLVAIPEITFQNKKMNFQERVKKTEDVDRKVQ